MRTIRTGLSMPLTSARPWACTRPPPWSRTARNCPLSRGSLVTVEPGGQVEISGPASASVPRLIEDTAADAAELTDLLAAADLVPGEHGLDAYRPPRRLLTVPRYAAMERAFERLGPHGPRMMCSTAGLQVCLDAGEPDQTALRWRALHDLGPALVALFANSRRQGRHRHRLGLGPDGGHLRHLRPVHRTTGARRRSGRRPGPGLAMDAPVLCLRRGDSWDAPAGLTFGAWADGALPGPTGRRTTTSGTTCPRLFPPVRPRGYLEVRYLDAQPADGWIAPTVLLSALMSDPAVVDQALAAAEPAAGRWLPGRPGAGWPTTWSAGPPGRWSSWGPPRWSRIGVDQDLGTEIGNRLHCLVDDYADVPRKASLMNHQLSDLSVEGLRAFVAEQLDRSRARTVRLTDAVDTDDLVRQHSRLMSPLVWDYAHIGNQEELWLVRDVGGREPVRQDIDELYDAFMHARADRPSLPLLGPVETRAYVGEVRDKVLDVLDHVPVRRRSRLVDNAFAFGMIVQHEQQHDETMLATHQLRTGVPVLDAPAPPSGRRLPAAEVLVPGGEFVMGTSTEPWALDNERPAHPVHVAPYVIDTAPVTNGDYLAFVTGGGYDDARWWSEAGWAHVQKASLVGAAVLGAGRRQLAADPVRPSRAAAARRAGDARLLLRGRGVCGLGGQAAADRGRVGDGRAVRPGDRADAAVPVG